MGFFSARVGATLVGRVRGLVVVAAFGVLLSPGAARAAQMPSLAWSPAGGFGTLDVGAGQTSKSITFTLTNSGGAATGALSISLTGASAFKITANSCTGTSLGPGKKCSVTVRYTQAAAGQSNTATLTATSTKPAATTHLTLSGATGSPSLSWSPTTGTGIFNFGSVPFPNTVTQTFTLTNSGTGSTGTLGASSPAAGGNFWIPSGDDGCQGANLAPGASCSVTVAFTPYDPMDSTTGTLSAGGQSIELAGHGGLSSLSVNPATFGGNPGGTSYYGYSFGAWSQGSGPTQTFTLTNTGPGSTTVPTLELGASSAFSIANDNCSDTTLADGGSCTFQVTYTSPSNTPGCGSHATVDLSVRSFDLLQLELSGDCGTPSFAWSQGANPVSSYDFGTVDGVGGATGSQTFTLTNSGTGDAAALGASIINGTGFSIANDGCDGASLKNTGPGSSCEVTVQWAPTTTGQSGTGTLTAGGQSVNLTGSGGTPDLAWSPTTQAGEYDFIPVPIPAFADYTFTLTNSSSATGSSGSLNASMIANTEGDGFTLRQDGCVGLNLAPGATCNVVVRFQPDTSVFDDAQLSVNGTTLALSGHLG